MFDFANSSYTTVVVTFAFSLYFTRLVAAGPAADLWWGRGITVSNLIVLLLSPMVGAIADDSGRKKAFLFGTYVLCVAGTASLWFVRPGYVLTGLALFVASNVAFSFGENFAAAFLPEISTPKNVGRISGFGWGLGYFGGLLSLLVILPFVKDGFELTNLENLRRVWLTTAAFFLVAALPTFLVLRERAPRRSAPARAVRARAASPASPRRSTRCAASAAGPLPDRLLRLLDGPDQHHRLRQRLRRADDRLVDPGADGPASWSLQLVLGRRRLPVRLDPGPHRRAAHDPDRAASSGSRSPRRWSRPPTSASSG